MFTARQSPNPAAQRYNENWMNRTTYQRIGATLVVTLLAETAYIERSACCPTPPCLQSGNFGSLPHQHIPDSDDSLTLAQWSPSGNNNTTSPVTVLMLRPARPA